MNIAQRADFMLTTIIGSLIIFGCGNRSSADQEAGFDLFALLEESMPLQESVEQAAWMTVNVLREGDEHTMALSRVSVIDGHYVRIGPVMHQVATSHKHQGVSRQLIELVQRPQSSDSFPPCLCGPDFRMHIILYDEAKEWLGIIALAPNHETIYIWDDTQESFLRHGLGHGKEGPVTDTYAQVVDLLVEELP